MADGEKKSGSGDFVSGILLAVGALASAVGMVGGVAIAKATSLPRIDPEAERKRLLLGEVDADKAKLTRMMSSQDVFDRSQSVKPGRSIRL